MGKIISTTNNYGVSVDIYNETYSLLSHRKNKEGRFWGQWGRLVVGKDNALAEKASPVKVVLGDKAEAVQVLQELLEMIHDKDIPF